MLSAVVLDQSQHSIDIVLNCITRRCWLAATEKTHSLTAGQPVNGPCQTRNGCYHSHQRTKRHFRKHSFCAKSCRKRKKNPNLSVRQGQCPLLILHVSISCWNKNVKIMLKRVDELHPEAYCFFFLPSNSYFYLICRKLFYVNSCDLLTEVWSLKQTRFQSAQGQSHFFFCGIVDSGWWLVTSAVDGCFCTQAGQQQRAQ